MVLLKRVRGYCNSPCWTEIPGGRVQISGSMNTEEARDISLLLRSGALAVPMNIIEERIVGPSLGKENVDRGILSTWTGY